MAGVCLSVGTLKLGPLGTSLALHAVLGTIVAASFAADSQPAAQVRLTSQVTATTELREPEPPEIPPLDVERPDDEVEIDCAAEIVWTEPTIEPPPRVSMATIGLENPAIPRRLRRASPSSPVAVATSSPIAHVAVTARVQRAPVPPPVIRGPTRGARPLADNAPPVYPRLAERRGYAGVVRLAVHVNAAGAVTEVEVVEGSGHVLLDAAARRAAEAWGYEPALRDGVPVACVVRRTVRFVL